MPQCFTFHRPKPGKGPREKKWPKPVEKTNFQGSPVHGVQGPIAGKPWNVWGQVGCVLGVEAVLKTHICIGSKFQEAFFSGLWCLAFHVAGFANEPPVAVLPLHRIHIKNTWT